MKLPKLVVHGKSAPISSVRFEEQKLTSFSGLIVFQKFFAMFGLKERLRQCFRHLKVSPIYGHHVIVLLLVVHLLLGYRELRDLRYYQDDEMVKRLLGLKRLPDVATVSRGLANADERSVENVRGENRDVVLDRLASLSLARVTMDFDGSVQSTGRLSKLDDSQIGARHRSDFVAGYSLRNPRHRALPPGSGVPLLLSAG